MSKGNEPAFGGTAMTGFNGDSQFVVTSGLSKREYFAGLAMQAVITGTLDSAINTARCLSKPEKQVVAIIAVAYADALLAELEKTNDQ